MGVALFATGENLWGIDPCGQTAKATPNLHSKQVFIVCRLRHLCPSHERQLTGAIITPLGGGCPGHDFVQILVQAFGEAVQCQRMAAAFRFGA